MTVRIRHLEGGPATARTCGISTEAGEVVSVSEGLARRLVQRTYLGAVDCLETTDSGRTCGRERPCRYHDVNDPDEDEVGESPAAGSDDESDEEA